MTFTILIISVLTTILVAYAVWAFRDIAKQAKLEEEQYKKLFKDEYGVDADEAIEEINEWYKMTGAELVKELEDFRKRTR